MYPDICSLDVASIYHHPSPAAFLRTPTSTPSCSPLTTVSCSTPFLTEQDSLVDALSSILLID